MGAGSETTGRFSLASEFVMQERGMQLKECSGSIYGRETWGQTGRSPILMVIETGVRPVCPRLFTKRVSSWMWSRRRFAETCVNFIDMGLDAPPVPTRH